MRTNFDEVSNEPYNWLWCLKNSLSLWPHRARDLKAATAVLLHPILSFAYSDHVPPKLKTQITRSVFRPQTLWLLWLDNWPVKTQKELLSHLLSTTCRVYLSLRYFRVWNISGLRSMRVARHYSFVSVPSYPHSVCYRP